MEGIWEKRFTTGKVALTSALVKWGFPGGSDGQESVGNVGDPGSVPGLGRSPGGGHGNPLQYSGLENPQGQRSLAGYRPWCARSETRLSDQA